MPKGPRGEKRPADTNACAVMVGRIATGDVKESDYRVAGRRRSGLAGAKARAEKLSADQRSRIAKEAASARWQGRIRSENMSGMDDRLHSLLFKEGRELVN